MQPSHPVTKKYKFEDFYATKGLYFLVRQGHPVSKWFIIWPILAL